MTALMDPASYETWYHSPRGQWIGEVELSILIEMMQPDKGGTLLDVGSGTGYFSRRFSSIGLKVTGLDPDPAMIKYTQTQVGEADYIEGLAQHLPFEDNSFDYCTAVTSLCFIDEPVTALAEMWRVSQRGVALGLLNHNSLLYRKKHGRGSYTGARWDTWTEVKKWITVLLPYPARIQHKTAIFFPGGGMLARFAESLLPGTLPLGGFLAVYLRKPV